MSIKVKASHYDVLYEVCDLCGECFPEDEVVYEDDGSILCEACAESQYY